MRTVDKHLSSLRREAGHKRSMRRVKIIFGGPHPP